MAAVKALQQWCKVQCAGYRDVAVTNMTTSFRDGLAFCALIHKHRPDLINFDNLNKENVYENNKLAFRVAEEELGIPALLDAEDMVALKVPDRLSILTYVSQYYNYFHGRSPIGGIAGVKRPAEEPVERTSGKKNQPVTAKVYGLPKAVRGPKSEVLVERSNKQCTLSSNCNVCNEHVHLVQRHLVDGKLYHRNCFKCRECANILLSGTYKTGKEPNTFICKSHQNTLKPPTVQTSQITVLTRNAQATPTVPKSLMSPAPSAPKVSSVGVASKNNSRFDPAPAKPTPPTSEVKSVKSPSVQKVPAESPKAPSNTVLKTQEAKQRFFGTSSFPSAAPLAKPAVASPALEKPTVGSGGAGSVAGNGRVLLRVGSWSKENKEKENDDEKQRAKTVISKLVIEETSKSGSRSSSSSSPLGQSGGLRTNIASKNTLPLDVGSKAPTKVRISPLVSDVELTVNKASGDHGTKDKNSANVGNKDGEKAPSDWRALLKPVTKDTKTATSKDSTLTSKHKTSGTLPRPSEPHPKNSPSISPPTATFPTSRSSSTLPSNSLLGDSTAAPGGKTVERRQNLNVAIDTPPFSFFSAAKTQKLKKPDYIPKEEILKELKEIELNLDKLEKQGVELEKQLRQCEEEGEEDVLTNDLMVDWFNLIRNKQVYIRRESELVYVGRSQDLEDEQPTVEAELRNLMDKPDHLKTLRDRKREEELMAKLFEIVNDRNAIVDGLDEDRLREEEEDEELNKMMQNLDMKKEKKKRSSFSKFFGLKSKQESVDD